MAGRSEGHFIKGGDIWDYHFKSIVKDKKEVKRLDHKNHCRIGTALIATASVGTIVSLFSLSYGFLYQNWVIVWCSLCLLAIIFIDLWKVSLHEKQEA